MKHYCVMAEPAELQVFDLGNEQPCVVGFSDDAESQYEDRVLRINASEAMVASLVDIDIDNVFAKSHPNGYPTTSKL
jgi:hypothetical protein